MIIEKIDYNKPKYFPRNAKDYIINNNIEIFVASVFIDGLVKFKEFDEYSNKDEKFIVKLNNFENSFTKIISISSKMKKIIDSLNKDFHNLSESINALNFNELNSKIRRIFDLAVKYERNYTARRFIPKANGDYLCYNCLFSEYPIKDWDGQSDLIERYMNIGKFLRDYKFFIKNFLNLVYVDGEEAEDFLKVKFSELIGDYDLIVSIINDLNSKNKTYSFDKRLRDLKELNEEIVNIFDKFPATLLKVIFDFYYRSKGVEFTWDIIKLERKDYLEDVDFLKLVSN